jgi:hypothetical protein
MRVAVGGLVVVGGGGDVGSRFAVGGVVGVAVGSADSLPQATSSRTHSAIASAGLNILEG